MEGKKNDLAKDYLITQFCHLAEEIRFSKHQQMMATWYIFLLFGAIVHTHRSWWSEPRYTAIIASLILLITGLAFMYSCNNSQKNSRGRIKKVRDEFSLPCEMTEKKYSDPCCLNELSPEQSCEEFF